MACARTRAHAGAHTAPRVFPSLVLVNTYTHTHKHMLRARCLVASSAHTLRVTCASALTGLRVVGGSQAEWVGANSCAGLSIDAGHLLAGGWLGVTPTHTQAQARAQTPTHTHAQAQPPAQPRGSTAALGGDDAIAAAAATATAAATGTAAEDTCGCNSPFVAPPSLSLTGAYMSMTTYKSLVRCSEAAEPPLLPPPPPPLPTRHTRGVTLPAATRRLRRSAGSCSCSPQGWRCAAATAPPTPPPTPYGRPRQRCTPAPPNPAVSVVPPRQRRSLRRHPCSPAVAAAWDQLHETGGGVTAGASADHSGVSNVPRGASSGIINGMGAAHVHAVGSKPSRLRLKRGDAACRCLPVQREPAAGASVVSLRWGRRQRGWRWRRRRGGNDQQRRWRRRSAGLGHTVLGAIKEANFPIAASSSGCGSGYSGAGAAGEPHGDGGGKGAPAWRAWDPDAVEGCMSGGFALDA